LVVLHKAYHNAQSLEHKVYFSLLTASSIRTSINLTYYNTCALNAFFLLGLLNRIIKRPF